MTKQWFSPFTQKKDDSIYNNAKNRDVYDEQDTVRGSRVIPVSAKARIIAGVVTCIGIFFSTWALSTLVVLGIIKMTLTINLDSGLQGGGTFWANWFVYGWNKLWISLGTTALIGIPVCLKLWRNYETQRVKTDHSDINTYENDQHVALPMEVMKKFEWFPDVGAHASPQVSSMISHVALSNKGIDQVEAAQFYTKADEKAQNGQVLAGEHKTDEDGNILFKKMPFFDKDFAEALFEASGITNKLKKYKKYYDTTKIPYMPDSPRDAVGGGKYKTVADVINADWELPYYEPQRPAGAYLVDVAPVNTMVLAMTRAGKGQGVIEPTIDMWTREKFNNNMVINDPKGELLVKFYVRAAVRGFHVVQFNLINPLNTDIYNPLMLAAQAAREGNITDAAMFIGNVADVFFPVDGADDPLWPTAAGNAFKRTTFEMIDNLLEEEKEMRQLAILNGTDPKILASELDRLWGQCTLRNAYEFFTSTTSKKLKNPVQLIGAKMKADMEKPESLRDHSNEEWEEKLALAQKQAEAWDGADELDVMTLYSNATAKLPRNSMRTLVSNADNSLRAMGGAEKMISSVYGIAITAMNFFTDPTISTLTSGTPSQTVDLAGLSFPRRLGVRFDPDYVSKKHLVGAMAKFRAYKDNTFTEQLGEDFDHDDTVSLIGWAKYYPKGIFEGMKGYIKLELYDRQSQMLIDTFHFEFVKTYQLDVTGRKYLEDPILGDRIVKDGVLYELEPVKRKNKKTGEIKEVFTRKVRMMSRKEIRRDGKTDWNLYDSDTPVIINTSVNYAEKQKAVFLVTPPHLMGYAKLILILIKQLADLNLGQSYLTKSNQAPLYKTRYMLDELGNLQSEGHGIQGLQTYLSIGLSAGQQFTLILQTLQQLRDVYGDSVDKIVQGNASNIVFLKSTDDDMLKTLETMSGTKHVSRADSKSVTNNLGNITNLNRADDKVTHNIATKEEPVIFFNDMAFIPDRNSMVFRAGDSPIWNRQEMILPMSWRLFQNTIVNPGHNYSLQTVPTLSTAMDFDVRKNRPDFNHWFNKRLSQMTYVDEAVEKYKMLHGFTDRDIEALDPDIYADDIMRIINSLIHEDTEMYEDDDMYDPTTDPMHQAEELMQSATENTELKEEVSELEVKRLHYDEKIYARGTVPRSAFVSMQGHVIHAFDELIKRSFREDWQKYADDTKNFTVVGGRDAGFAGHGNLLSADGTTVYLRFNKESDRLDAEDIDKLKEQMYDKSSNVFAENEDDIQRVYDETINITVTDDFYRFLISLSGHEFSKVAGGALNEALYREVKNGADYV